MKSPFLKTMTYLPERVGNGYVYNLPFLHDGLQINFDSPVTFFVGENGSGKTTLIEAIAQHIGFDSSGGSNFDGSHHSTPKHHLEYAFRFSWLPKIRQGFYFRAETFYTYASYIDDMAEHWPVVRDDFGGGKDLHEQSHGESFLSLFENRLNRNGRYIYLLDEPEAALSPKRQLRFLKLMQKWHSSGNVQAIIATHAPIIMSFKDAKILNFDDGLRPTTFQETSHYQVTKDVL